MCGGNLRDYHLAANRVSRQEGNEDIGLAYFRLNTLSPTFAYRHDLINKNIVLLGQCLEDLPGDRGVGLDALVTDENMCALRVGHVCSPLGGRRGSRSTSPSGMLP